MKVIALSGSPRKGKTTDRVIHEILKEVECETEFIRLSPLKISPCLACLSCVKDNICKIQDDMRFLREKIIEADAFIIGAPNYFSMLNGITHNFLERLCQFRHQSCTLLAGKLAVVVSTGGLQPEIPARQIEKIFTYYKIDHVGTVSAQGAASCFTCGYGEDCEAGAVQMIYGPGRRITEDIIPDLNRQPEKIIAAHDLGKLLMQRLLQKTSDFAGTA
ncbi:flavodoxin family protein [Desulfobacterota bacterium M19]